MDEVFTIDKIIFFWYIYSNNGGHFMVNLFKNKYRTHTTRLEKYDYSQGGYYFITICTDKKKLFFGKVDNGQMKLNGIGEIVEEELLKTSKIRKNVVIDKYVVMPNHLHVIIIIDNKFVERSQVIEPDSNLALQRKKFSSVETHCYASQNDKVNKFGPQKNNLPAIIRGFKGATTKRLHLLGYTNFKWQSGYYDHIIRNEQDYNNIWDYIDYNPDKWMWDRDNPERIKK